MQESTTRIELLAYKIALLKSGLTQRQIAVRLGLGDAQLSAMVNGRERMTVAIVEKIAAALGVPTSEILCRETVAG